LATVVRGQGGYGDPVQPCHRGTRTRNYRGPVPQICKLMDPGIHPSTNEQKTAQPYILFILRIPLIYGFRGRTCSWEP